MLLTLTLIPLAAAIAGLTWRSVVVRRVAVVVVVIAASAVLGGFMAPHRLAEELRGGRQSDEWHRGALATRDVIYDVAPVWGSAIIALALLAVMPVRKRE